MLSHMLHKIYKMKVKAEIVLEGKYLEEKQPDFCVI